MRKVAFKVLLVDSIPARIYMALLKKEGFYAAEVLFLDVESNSPKFLWVKRICGDWLTSKLLILKRRWDSKTSLDMVLGKKLLAKFGLTMADVEQQRILSGFENVDRVTVSGVNDPKLSSVIEAGSTKTLLFTGGGILEPSILSLSDVRFLHIHPGIVPEVKGADGLYWSWLIRGKAGYSVFYMNAGIDTGGILHQKEFDVSLTNVNCRRLSTDVIYRTLLQFYDPCLRALTLLDLIKEQANVSANEDAVDLSSLSYVEQEPSEGRTYFFMHEVLREFVIQELIKSE
jgi:hypothetical protein